MSKGLFKGYKKIEEYAKLHALKLQKGLISTTDSSDGYVEEKKFIIEINNKNGFVVAQFEGGVFIAICKKTVFASSDAFDRLDSITQKRTSMLIVVETCAEINKLKNYININKPIVNSISLQSFIINPLKHRFAPVLVELFNYDELEKIIMVQKNNLPEIDFNDPIIAYLRLIPGQVIKITDVSPLNGKCISYRIIK